MEFRGCTQNNYYFTDINIFEKKNTILVNFKLPVFEIKLQVFVHLSEKIHDSRVTEDAAVKFTNF